MAVLAYTPIRLTTKPVIQLAVNTEFTVFTATVPTIVKEIVLINTNASGGASVNAAVSLVASADSGGAVNRLIPDQAIAAAGNVQWDGALILNTGDKLTAKAATASVINIAASGVAFV